ncbi:MAG TPA: hypothetical protein VII72_06545 [Myxococcota bacterium]|jgi:hypothetical protein
MARSLRPLQLWISDRLYTASRRASGRRILVMRHTDQLPDYNDDLLGWLLRTAPAAATLFDLRRVGFAPRDPARYALFLPWLQDPLREEFPKEYRQAKRVEDAILDAGGAVVNPVEQLSNSIKSVASARLRAAGVPMPRVAPIPDSRELPEGFAFPVIAREDRRHGGPMHLCRDEQELAQVPWHALHEPVVVEYRDVQSPDGWFRKWRYLVAGESGAPRHLVISRKWVVKAQRRGRVPAFLEEELAYTGSRQDPHQEILVRAARALGLDVVAFDYALTREGELVVFEPNPFATLWASFNTDARYDYQRPCVERLYATLCAFWLERAGLLPDVGKELRELTG